MPLERFHLPKTPESRTPYVLALLGLIGLGQGLWSMWVSSPYSVELLLGTAAAAGAYAFWRYMRQRAKGVG